jgi:hypothetical protein
MLKSRKSWRIFLGVLAVADREKYVCRMIGVFAVVVLLLRVSDFFGGTFCFLFFYFWLCVSLISKLASDIILLQRLSVIGIILVLIYIPFIKKNELLRLCPGGYICHTSEGDRVKVPDLSMR